MSIEFFALPGSNEFQKAVQILKNGGIVAYPTETYYGLAVNPLNIEAVAALYNLKQRKAEKALSYLIPDFTMLSRHIEHFPVVYKLLAEKLWPGPLTLIFQASSSCKLPFKSKDNSLAFRISSHPVAHKFCCLWGDAITASSANISGKPAMSSAKAVKEQWGDQIDYILDGGITVGSTPSTIISCHKKQIRIVRAGVVSAQKIRKILPECYNICKSY